MRPTETSAGTAVQTVTATNRTSDRTTDRTSDAEAPVNATSLPSEVGTAPASTSVSVNPGSPVAALASALPGAGVRRRWWRAPLDLWLSSLPLRVISSVFVASVVVLVLGGVLLMQQASAGVLTAKDRAATAQVTQAVATAQARLDSLDYTNDTNINEVLRQVLDQISSRSGSDSQYQVILDTQVGVLKSSYEVSESSVPTDLRASVGADNQLWKAPTEVVTDGQLSQPGVAFGTVLTVSDTDSYPVFFIFPLTQEADTLAFLQRAVFSTGALLILLLTLIAALVSRQVVSPVRAARRAAERLALGNLDDRMTVRGTDDLARLAVSMNNMASELQKQISQLEELSAVQQRFVSDVSHELRTPLTTVRMAAEVLFEARADFDPLEARSAELMQEELDRFEALLADLLEISRFDAGAAVLTTEQVDVLELVTKVVHDHRSLAAKFGAEVKVHALSVCPAEVDPRRIVRVLRNLLTNAIEHSEGKPIDIFVETDGDAVSVAVRDHGVGFQAVQAKQVFLRFWRADPARARVVGGSGLGLAISMEDARLHGGWLNAWGRPSQGAQFRLTLPCRAGAVLEQSPLPLVPRDLFGAAPDDSAVVASTPAIVADPVATAGQEAIR